ncbi:MAG: HD domain-containing protein [Chloroflexota bacterium]|nr:HD domain-containing protein [Chloroflexota bacterium]
MGGPAAAAWVAAVGTTELREVDGRVPWYGTLFNHAALVLAAVGASLFFHALYDGRGFAANPPSLAAAIAAGTFFFLVNSALVAGAIALREGASVSAVYRGDWSVVAASFLALAPLAWLMAHAYATVGAWAAALFAIPLYTQRGAYRRIVELRDMFTQTVRSLASAVDAKDKFTSGHSERVQRIAVDIGRQMRCSEPELEALEWGGLLHDIGKIGVPDAVLLKQEKLTRDERVLMNQHPVKGEEIIKPVQRLAPELPIIRHHHEWYNGSGYPDHLEGEQIPKLARILSVADAFEAMTAARPYRMTPLTAEQALSELRKYAGIQFDPECVEAFARTRWVTGVPDPARPAPRPVPLLAQSAALRSEASHGADAP